MDISVTLPQTRKRLNEQYSQTVVSTFWLFTCFDVLLIANFYLCKSQTEGSTNCSETLMDQKPVNTKKGHKRTVSFHMTVVFILIPSLPEYHEAHLTPHLWWRRKDLEKFRRRFGIAYNKFLDDNLLNDDKYSVNLFLEQELSYYEEHTSEELMPVSSTALQRKSDNQSDYVCENINM